jgi:hypothetical protein
VQERPLDVPTTKSRIRMTPTMNDLEVIRRLNNYDTDSFVRVLELNEDQLYAWLVLGSPTVVRETLDESF